MEGSEHMTLWELIQQRAADTPDALLAVDEEGRRLTFGDYEVRAAHAAAGLAALGVGPGVNVSWELPTWLESMVLVAALARLGAVQNPILPIYREREVGFVLRQTGCRLFITPSEWRGFDYAAMAKELAGGIAGLDVLVVDRELPSGLPSDLAPYAAPAAELPVRWLFYTSGTTADPKGAQHTDATLAATARGMGQRLAVGPSDRNSLLFPLTHIAGPIWIFTSLLYGCSNILMETFDPERTVEVLRRENVTLAGSGTVFHLAYLDAQRRHGEERIFPHVRAFPGGGAPKPPQLHRDMKAAFGGDGILAGYGLTEAPILTMAEAADGDEALANTEGKAMPGVDLRIVDLSGRVAGPGSEGEVRAKAPQLMKGYLDAALDGEAFDEEGYFRTGDLGMLDTAGNLSITGRLKDIIIRKGENISAKEVEDLLYAHPKVADVAVIGLPDAKVGERCCAVIAVKDPADPIRFPEMVEFLKAAKLMTQKIPEQLEIVAGVPRNPSGKILKHKLREQFGA